MSNPQRKNKSLRSNLIQLVIVAVLPLIVFASALIFYQVRQLNLELERNLDGRAKSISAAVDDGLNSIISSLEIIAYTEDFSPTQFKNLHGRLRRAIDNLEHWDSIIVSDVKGHNLIHTSFEMGDRLYNLKEEPFYQTVLDTSLPSVSPYRVSPNTGKKVFSVVVPVMKNGKVEYYLTANITTDYLTSLLKKAALGKEWYASLVDQNHIIISRSRFPEKFVGEKASEYIIDQMQRSKKGVVTSVNKEGIETYSAFTRSQLSNWIVILGFPAAKISTFPKVLLMILVIALIAIVIGIILAIRIGQKISRPIVALTHAAQAFGRGYSPMGIQTDVEEIQILAKNLELASLQRIRSENTVRTIHEISASLAAELDLKKLLQSFTDQTVALTRAEFGIYFSGALYRNGSLEVVASSGASSEKISALPLKENIEFLRSSLLKEDMTKEQNFIQSESFPIRSFLSVPVVSRNGEVLGGLIFGHSRAGVFNEQDETLMGALTAQAATAIDNAGLYSKAKQAIELRDTFLSVASHELKTPLTSIYLQFEILKRLTLSVAANDKKVLNVFERFQSQLERFTRLINELLDVTKIAAGKMNLQPEKIELDRLVSDICANFESEAIFKGSPISLEIQDKIHGMWDANRIEQVLMNMVSNAIKYGNKKPISVMVKKEDKWAFIEIKDQGMGIAPEDQHRIFQRFERAIDSNNISGLGLGLFICKEIIVRHGGDIEVESTLGEGSTFTLKLPLL